MPGDLNRGFPTTPGKPGDGAVRGRSSQAAEGARTDFMLAYQGDVMEATSGIEPEYTVLQTVA